MTVNMWSPGVRRNTASDTSESNYILVPRPHPGWARLNCLTNTDPNLLPFTTLYWVMSSNSIIWTPMCPMHLMYPMYPMRCFVATGHPWDTKSRISNPKMNARRSVSLSTRPPCTTCEFRFWALYIFMYTTHTLCTYLCILDMDLFLLLMVCLTNCHLPP